MSLPSAWAKQHLLTPKVHISRKLALGAKLNSNSDNLTQNVGLQEGSWPPHRTPSQPCHFENYYWFFNLKGRETQTDRGRDRQRAPTHWATFRASNGRSESQETQPHPWSSVWVAGTQWQSSPLPPVSALLESWSQEPASEFRGFFQVFQADAGAQAPGPSSAFPGCICRELDLKWGSQDLNQCLHGILVSQVEV